MDRDTSSGVLCVVGPTASGKSSLGYRIARQFGAEVINFDSRQIYRDFPIITDQPGDEYTATVAHWLYGFLDFYDRIDAAYFQNLARQTIADVQSRNRLPVLVGGTGLYLHSVLYGLDPLPQVPGEARQEVLQEWSQKGAKHMYSRLQQVDPEYSIKVHPHDKQRITRALEVYKATGEPFSNWHQDSSKKVPEYDFLKLGVWMDVNSLTSRLKQRIDYMLQNGAVEEVRLAWDKYPREDAHGWSAIGCFELLQYILGRWSLEQAKKNWLRRTKKYAKRQLTWFKKEDDIHWISSIDDEKPEQLISNWMEKNN